MYNSNNDSLELYAGLGVAVVGAMPSVGLYFGVYSYCKDNLIPFFQTKFSQEGERIAMSKSAAKTLAIASSAAIGNTVASFSRVVFHA